MLARSVRHCKKKGRANRHGMVCISRLWAVRIGLYGRNPSLMRGRFRPNPRVVEGRLPGPFCCMTTQGLITAAGRTGWGALPESAPHRYTTRPPGPARWAHRPTGRPAWSKPGVRVVSFDFHAPFSSNLPEQTIPPSRHALNASYSAALE